MPAMIFTAVCPACNEPRKFMELKAEPCGPMSSGTPEYAFRCMTCKTKVDRITDQKGKTHAWTEGKHVEA